MMNNIGVINNKTDKWIIIAEIKKIKWIYIIKVFENKPEVERCRRR